MIKLKQYRFKSRISLNIYLYLILITILLLIFIPPEIAAEHREFESEKFNERITLAINDHKAIDFIFQKGKILEIIYTVQIKEELPIDFWFVNEDNYLLLSGGSQFLYFLDGTGQQVSYGKKVVTLTKHDNYKLVLTNYYNNQTVDVNVMGEIRTFEDNIKESSSNFNQIILYSLIVVSIIFIIITIVLGFKLHRSNRANIIELNKNSTRKFNTNKPKKKKNKNKNKYSGKKAKNKKSKETKDTKKETKTGSKSSGYCGYCGEAVSTPYCKHCGRKV